VMFFHRACLDLAKKKHKKLKISTNLFELFVLLVAGSIVQLPQRNGFFISNPTPKRICFVPIVLNPQAV